MMKYAFNPLEKLLAPWSFAPQCRHEFLLAQIDEDAGAHGLIYVAVRARASLRHEVHGFVTGLAHVSG